MGESFSWKSLFINEDPTQENKQEEVKTPDTSTNKFPNETFVTHPIGFATNPHINEILEVYEKGFETLNIEGFDFFELYKSVIAVGPTNPQSYQMAFTMGKTIKSDLTKEFLLDKAKFYISEIEKVHADFDAKGNKRRNDLEMGITRDKINLTKSISDLETKILELQRELESKKIELDKIDVSNREQFSEIQLKVEANNFAKQKILDSINLVISGVNQYL